MKAPIYAVVPYYCVPQGVPFRCKSAWWYRCNYQPRRAVDTTHHKEREFDPQELVIMHLSRVPPRLFINIVEQI